MIDLKAIRSYYGWTQKELGYKLGVSQETISDWETKRRLMPQKYFEELKMMSKDIDRVPPQKSISHIRRDKIIIDDISFLNTANRARSCV